MFLVEVVDFKDLIMWQTEFSLELSWLICVLRDSVLSKVRLKKFVQLEILINRVIFICIDCKFIFYHILDIVSFNKV